MPEFRISHSKDKKYDVLYNGHWIPFGQKGFEHYKTSNKIPQSLHIYKEHHDEARRKAYQRRASQITNAQGVRTFLNKNYPNYWAFHFLW